jgi:hypothetical protein
VESRIALSYESSRNTCRGRRVSVTVSIDVALPALAVEVEREGEAATTSKPMGDTASSVCVVAWYRNSL